MSYDIDDYDGYLIDLEMLLRDFPEKLAAVTALYGDWMNETIDAIVAEFVSEHIHEELSVTITGRWYGDLKGRDPFGDGRAYACFSKNELLDEVRKDVEAELSESSLFARLKAFMKEHGIPEESLRYAEWKFGG